jgi:hypothetical protein
MAGFTKNSEVLEEKFQTEDLFGIQNYVNDLLVEVYDSPTISLYGIIGEYGTGKSVMLESLRRIVATTNPTIHIDAWRYPDRRDLWEGFVLDFAAQIDKKTFLKVKKKLDGDGGAASTLMKSAGDLGSLWIPKFDKITDKLTYFTRTSPAKRIYEIQDILITLIEDADGDTIYIVIEDADRSGPAGIYFIETLSQYLKSMELSKAIKVFVPVARTSFEKDKESYIKCLDYIKDFGVDDLDVDKFVDAVFKEKYTADKIIKDHLKAWLYYLLKNRGITIRHLKLILRNSEGKYRVQLAAGLNPDLRMTIMFESARHFTASNGGGEKQHASFLRSSSIQTGDIFTTLLLAVLKNITYEAANASIKDRGASVYLKTFHLVDDAPVSEHTGTAIPFEERSPTSARLACPKFYLN